MTPRENDIREARILISDNNLIAFLRAALYKIETRETELINKKLDDGESLDSIFYTGLIPGFSISVEQSEGSYYEIYFGFLMGFSGGIGNWWKVYFDTNGLAATELMENKMSAREITIRQSRRLITDKQLTAFFRALRAEYGVIAINIINKHLDKGDALDSIFYTGGDDGFKLIVESEAYCCFDISFGCQAGALAGDSGSWTVAFDDVDRIVSIEGGSTGLVS